MSKIGVIFDMDGVLIDSNAAHFAAFQKLGQSLGVEFTREHLNRTFGMHNNQIMPLWLGEELSAERVEELARVKEQMYREIAPNYIKAIPGAVELVQALYRDGYPLAVGSSGPKANVELAIRTLNVGQYFHSLTTGDDVTHGKPRPDIFLKAASKLGLKPEHCLVIEDAPQGVKAALAAQMPVIAVTTSRPREELKEAHLIVDSLVQLTVDQVLEVHRRAGRRQ